MIASNCWQQGSAGLVELVESQAQPGPQLKTTAWPQEPGLQSLEPGA